MYLIKCMVFMEINEDISSRPSIGFPLGLVLLLLMLVCMTAFFSCCVHWDNLRSLLSSRHARDVESPAYSHPILKLKEEKELKTATVVLMPGDEFPKFMAMACPCHPPLWDKVVLIQVHNPLTFHLMPIH